MFRVPEPYRLLLGPLATTTRDGRNGCFILPPKIGSRQLACIVSDGLGWFHVSVHAMQGKRVYTPTWIEMCYVKDIFWEDEDVVIQYHPRKSEYVSNFDTCLHLWQPDGVELPEPPTSFVGVKGVTDAEMKKMSVPELHALRERLLDQVEES